MPSRTLLNTKLFQALLFRILIYNIVACLMPRKTARLLRSLRIWLRYLFQLQPMKRFILHGSGSSAMDRMSLALPY
mgnify:CR=1 FL=1